MAAHEETSTQRNRNAQARAGEESGRSAVPQCHTRRTRTHIYDTERPSTGRFRIPRRLTW